MPKSRPGASGAHDHDDAVSEDRRVPPATGRGDHRLRRSVLYVPASNPRALAKAPALDCDAVILDL
jgi:hypothetical protein